MKKDFLSRVAGRLTLGATVMRPRHPLRWMWMRLAGRFAALRGNLDKVSGITLLDEAGSLFPALQTAGAVAELRRCGFAPGLTLPADIVEELHAFFAARPCFPNGDKSISTTVQSATASSAVTAYYHDTMDSPTIRRIAEDPKILNICRSYFGVKPCHLGNQAWWSFPINSTHAQQSKFAQQFHFDLDGWRFLKFFFYLTDVRPGTGEHVFVLETHRRRPMRYQASLRRFSDAAIARDFPGQNIKQILGPAGSGFVEDTFGIHKGMPPTAAPRLYFEIEYADQDWGTPNDKL